MVILHMDFEVLGKMLDALAEERDLHFGRAGVRRMNSELLNHLFSLRFSNPHNLRFFLSFFFSCRIFNTLAQPCKAAHRAVEALTARKQAFAPR